MASQQDPESQFLFLFLVAGETQGLCPVEAPYACVGLLDVQPPEG